MSDIETDTLVSDIESDIESDTLDNDIESDTLNSDIESDTLLNDYTYVSVKNKRIRKSVQRFENVISRSRSTVTTTLKKSTKSIGTKDHSYDPNYRAKYGPKLLLAQCAKCNLCKAQLKEDYIVDHILQKKYTFDQKYEMYHCKINDISNMQALCTMCNRMKTYKVDKEIDRSKVMDRKWSFDDLRAHIMKLLQSTYEKDQEEMKYFSTDVNADVNKDKDLEECEYIEPSQKRARTYENCTFQNCTFQNCTFK